MPRRAARAGQEPETREALFAELAAAGGRDRHYDAALARLPCLLEDAATLEYRSRAVVERTALLLQAAVLLRAGQEEIAAAFCRSRLAGEHGLAFGTLGPDAPVALLIGRAMATAA